MKNTWLIAVLPLLVIVCSGWFWNDKKEEPTVVGIWKSVKPDLQGMRLKLDNEGRFTADFDQGEVDDILGDYQILGDRIIFDDNESVSDTLCREKAYYYYKLSHGELWLTLIADACLPRRTVLPGRWAKIEIPVEKNNKKVKSNENKDEMIIHEN